MGLVKKTYYKRNKKEYNSSWLQIPNYPYKILIIGGYRSGKTNLLFDLINYQISIKLIYLLKAFK